MKYFFTMLFPTVKMSLPSRERGLKCRYCEQLGESKIVAPLTGAWIEIPDCKHFSKAKGSLPSRERGLKSSGLLESFTWWQSLPSRERGLK